jgi:hypothetical protein
MKASYLKFRLLLGTVSLIIGLLAANFALFGWHNPDGFFYLLGEYARYVCAYGGFAAIIFGAMLINDFFVLRASIASKRNTKRNATAWLIRARTEWQLCKDFEKYCSMEPKLPQLDFFFETKEELEVVAQ